MQDIITQRTTTSFDDVYGQLTSAAKDFYLIIAAIAAMRSMPEPIKPTTLAEREAQRKADKKVEIGSESWVMGDLVRDDETLRGFLTVCVHKLRPAQVILALRAQELSLAKDIEARQTTFEHIKHIAGEVLNQPANSRPVQAEPDTLPFPSPEKLSVNLPETARGALAQGAYPCTIPFSIDRLPPEAPPGFFLGQLYNDTGEDLPHTLPIRPQQLSAPGQGPKGAQHKAG